MKMVRQNADRNRLEWMALLHDAVAVTQPIDLRTSRSSDRSAIVTVKKNVPPAILARTYRGMHHDNAAACMGSIAPK
jgi:hypothetical protein